MKARTTVTIARRMGSGGSYVGQGIARRLGLRYIDREVLHLAAESLGVDAAALEPNRERVASFWEKLFGGLTFGPPETTYAPPPLRTCTDRELFERQVEILREIAAREDCVIVGYGGAFVLPRHARMVNFYFHAPLKFRVRRIMEIYQIADRERAMQLVADSDEMRQRYFKQMIGRDWACADNYHVCVDTSMLPLPELVDRLVNFIGRRLGAEPEG
jgi:cytidylate kinase